MVGVPRSKGCRICVQRRVRCDQTRPICNNCKKGNRPCPGYGQDLKFQDESQKLRKRFAKTPDSQQHSYETSFTSDASPRSDHTESVTAATSPESVEGTVSSNNHLMVPAQGTTQRTNHWDIVGVDIATSNRRSFIGLLEGKRESYMKLDDVKPNLHIDVVFNPDANFKGRRSFMFDGMIPSPEGPPEGSLFQSVSSLYSPHIQQRQLLDVFRNSLAPNNQTLQTIPVNMRNHSRWLDYVPPLTGTNKLLDTAVRAVTLVHIGRLNNSQQYVNESRPYYGQALKLLNTALQDHDAGMSNETLCATILLSFYEMFASDNNHAWIRHAGGAGALMKMRGPSRHRTGFDREILLAYRYTLVIEAFQQDMPCFLAEPEWQEVTKSIHADLKASGINTPRMQIFDLAEDYYNALVFVPELSAQALFHYHAAHPDPSNPMPRPTIPLAPLIERLQESRTHLKSTFARFEAALKATGHAPTIQLTPRDPVCSISYEFINTFVSSSFTGYWTVLSVLNMSLAGLVDPHKDLKALYQMENRENALNIMRTTNYALKSSFLGPFFVIFGLRMALMIFEETGGPECDWVIRRLFEIGDRHMGIAKDMPGYESGSDVEDVLIRFKEAKLKAAQSEEERQRWNHSILESKKGRTNAEAAAAAGMNGVEVVDGSGSEAGLDGVETVLPETQNVWDLAPDENENMQWTTEDFGDFSWLSDMSPAGLQKAFADGLMGTTDMD